MIIAGIKPFTLIDYSGKIACTLFIYGCNFRCSYCYNRKLVLEEPETEIKIDEIIDFLKLRSDFLDGICITGGEPTIHMELPFFLEKIKSEGYNIKLDTNGSNPTMLQKLINEKLVDYVALDIKAPINEYEKITRVKINKRNIQKSVNLLRNGNVDYEYRTTIVPGLIGKNELKEIGEWLKGSTKFFLQQFKPVNTLNEAFVEIKPFPEETLQQYYEFLKPNFNHCAIRGLNGNSVFRSKNNSITLPEIVSDHRAS